jgi:hypothetical protein
MMEPLADKTAWKLRTQALQASLRSVTERAEGNAKLDPQQPDETTPVHTHPAPAGGSVS